MSRLFYFCLSAIILLSCTKDPTSDPSSDPSEKKDTVQSGFAAAGRENCTVEDYSEIQAPWELDFSRVGYHWGDDEIPAYSTVAATLTPSGEDDYQQIQDAIDGWNGKSGVIQLSEGIFKVSKTIRLRRSGLVLRGTISGGKPVTTIYKTGTSTEDIIQVGGEDNTYADYLDWSAGGRILPSHTPVGAFFVEVENAAPLVPGETVAIVRYPNQDWIDGLRMTAAYGLEYPWLPEDFNTCWERVVLKVEGDRVFLDNPVVMALDSQYGGCYLLRQHRLGRIRESGVEDLVLDCQYDSSVKQNDYYSFYQEICSDENHAHTGVKFVAAEHCWVRGVETHHLYMAAVQFGTACKNCTAIDCNYLEPVSTISGSRRYAYTMGNGQLNLVKNCKADEARHSYITTGNNAGPNVFTQSSATRSFDSSGPHNKWSTGTLYDCLTLTGQYFGKGKPTSGTSYTSGTDRGHGLLQIQDAYNWGSTDSQGWEGANSVLWNCESEIYVCQNPWITSQNWAWGCTGVYKYSSNTTTTEQGGRNQGNISSDGQHIVLEGYESLYEYQLANRKARGVVYFVPGFEYNIIQ